MEIPSPSLETPPSPTMETIGLHGRPDLVSHGDRPSPSLETTASPAMETADAFSSDGDGFHRWSPISVATVSHDASHVWRVRDMALSLAHDQGLSSNPDSMLVVELAALLHDIGDYKYLRDPSEENIVENFLEEEGLEEQQKTRILSIIKRMGFKDELSRHANGENSLEFGVVQDADRLDAIGAIVSGIVRCFTFGGSRNRVLHDPNILPRSDLSKEQYIKKEEQTTVNHFHEKLLKLKDLMKTEAGRRRAEKRHNFMEEFLKEFYEEWDGRA